MGLKFTVESGVPDVEDGMYDASLAGIALKTWDSPDGTREFLVWTFDVNYGGEVVALDGTSSKMFSPKSKGFEWVSGLLGRAPGVGDDIDVDALVGTACRVLIAKDKNGYPKVDKVLAASKRAAQPAPAKAPVAAAVAPAPEDLSDIPF